MAANPKSTGPMRALAQAVRARPFVWWFSVTLAGISGLLAGLCLQEIANTGDPAGAVYAVAALLMALRLIATRWRD